MLNKKISYLFLCVALIFALVSCASAKSASVDSVAVTTAKESTYSKTFEIGGAEVGVSRIDDYNYKVTYPADLDSATLISYVHEVYEAFSEDLEGSSFVIRESGEATVNTKTPISDEDLEVALSIAYGKISNLVDFSDESIAAAKAVVEAKAAEVKAAAEALEAELAKAVEEAKAEEAAAKAAAEAEALVAAEKAAAEKAAAEAQALVAAEKAAAEKAAAEKAAAEKAAAEKAAAEKASAQKAAEPAKVPAAQSSAPQQAEKKGLSVFWIILIIICILIIIYLLLSRRKKVAKPEPAKAEPVKKAEPPKAEVKKAEAPKAEAPKAEAKPVKAEPAKVEPVKKEETIIMPEVQKAAPKAKKVVERPRFYGINTLASLRALARDSADGADKAVLEIQECEANIKAINSDIYALRADNSSSAQSRKEALRADKRKNVQRIEYLKEYGKTLEVGADTYSYLIEELTGNAVEFRKTERFAEKDVNVSKADLKWLKDHLGL